MRGAYMALAIPVLLAGCSSSSNPASSGIGIAARNLPFTTLALGRVAHRGSANAVYSAKKSLVFEGDIGESMVNIYQTSALASNPAPIASIAVQEGCPQGLAMDKRGTLYVADQCFTPGDIEEYAKGSTTEKLQITNGVSNPSGMAVDSKGTLYASMYPPAIEEYNRNQTSPSNSITGQGLTDPFGLALDTKGNLYVADFGAHAVFEVAAGTQTVTNLNLEDLTEPIGVAVDDKDGYLWVTDGEGDKINVYQLGQTAPFEEIPGAAFPYAIGLENKGNPRDTVVISDIDDHEFFAFKAGQYSPYATVTNGVVDAAALVIEKP